jgi:hypothetical protein
MLSAKKLPRADPFSPSKPFNSPASPVVAVFDPGAKGLVPTEADDNGDASPCSELGTLETTCDSVDCTPLVVAVPVAWATAPAWPAVPAGLAVSGGALSAGTVVASADLQPVGHQLAPEPAAADAGGSRCPDHRVILGHLHLRSQSTLEFVTVPSTW